MLGLYLTQVLVLGHWLAAEARLPCFNESVLEVKARQKLGHLDDDLRPEASAARRCSVEPFQNLGNINNRSISPWWYTYDTQENRFPRRIAVAKCLCEGCIMAHDRPPGNLYLSEDFISVPILQRKMFLLKELCEDGKHYRLRFHHESVAVGCTCVKPKSITG